MNRPWHIGIAFVASLAVVLTAMGWISFIVLRLDKTEQETLRQAELEENVRLALWRMDSALAPLIAQEGARPYFSYSAFYAPERTYTKMFAPIERGEVQIPSPLLTQPSPHILLHFQFEPDGTLSSPQVPTGNNLDLAESYCTTHDKVVSLNSRLTEFRSVVDLKALFALLPEIQTIPRQTMPDASPQQSNPRSTKVKQQQFNKNEWTARDNAQTNFNNSYNIQVDNIQQSSESGLQESVMKPLWLGQALLLARRVKVNGQGYVQGCWLDWPELKSWLLGQIKDLLPDANLVSANSFSSQQSVVREHSSDDHASDFQSRMLAALPICLVPGTIPIESAVEWSSIQWSLCIAWGCVLLAAAAVAVLLLGAVSLSERRGAFVSAVTHELRTPLTTFRLYTEMLSCGMVADEATRQKYLATLSTEANRLSHLVENVLAYARLERGSIEGRMQTLSACELLERSNTRLAERTTQAGVELVLDVIDDPVPVMVQADPSAVEQILFNLVDNACKYAVLSHSAISPSGSENKTVEPLVVQRSPVGPQVRLSVERMGALACIRVKDNGPGITKRQARRLFQPFSKSAREAAHSAPGVGLGLALSRRLARDMGGDLYLDHGINNGACFVLQLQAADV